VTTSPASDPFRSQRLDMVEHQLRERGIDDEHVLAAMRTVPRHRFLPESLLDEAYADRALSLGPDSSISQPYIVGLMTSLAIPAKKVLEIGTGSGYQAAVLAELVETVHTIELDHHLAEQATWNLKAMSYRNVESHIGDGRHGWRAAAPYDAILVTAGAEQVPEELLRQLVDGGRIILPVGSSKAAQSLRLIEKDGGELRQRDVTPVRFVPLLGED
jgi:protein-L-isoaspartate(D-aspartate) O-methyltransferase